MMGNNGKWAYIDRVGHHKEGLAYRAKEDWFMQGEQIAEDGDYENST